MYEWHRFSRFYWHEIVVSLLLSYCTGIGTASGMGLWINRYIVRSSVLQMIAIKCFFWRSCHALTDEYNPWMKGRRDSSFLPSKEYV